MEQTIKEPTAQLSHTENSIVSDTVKHKKEEGVKLAGTAQLLFLKEYVLDELKGHKKADNEGIDQFFINVFNKGIGIEERLNKGEGTKISFHHYGFGTMRFHTIDITMREGKKYRFSSDYTEFRVETSCYGYYSMPEPVVNISIIEGYSRDPFHLYYNHGEDSRNEVKRVIKEIYDSRILDLGEVINDVYEEQEKIDETPVGEPVDIIFHLRQSKIAEINLYTKACKINEVA